MATRALLTWVLFFIGGLPRYYQQYDPVAIAVGSSLLAALVGVAAVAVLGRVPSPYRYRQACWISAYFTVPFVVLDAAYLIGWLGAGPSAFVDHWYLTVFYVVPWIAFPGAAWALERAQVRKG